MDAHPRAPVPAYVAEEHGQFARQAGIAEPLPAQRIVTWLEHRGWSLDPSKARAGDRAYATRGRPYTPPDGGNVLATCSELLQTVLSKTL